MVRAQIRKQQKENNGKLERSPELINKYFGVQIQQNKYRTMNQFALKNNDKKVKSESEEILKKL